MNRNSRIPSVFGAVCRKLCIVPSEATHWLSSAVRCGPIARNEQTTVRGAAGRSYGDVHGLFHRARRQEVDVTGALLAEALEALCRCTYFCRFHF